jgi:hypothetical protein
MNYIDALRKYNEGKDKWCVPRKGTEDYIKIRSMMNNEKKGTNEPENYKIRDWIPLNKIRKSPLLSLNHNAIAFLSLSENKKFINYHQLSKNKNRKAIELLKEKPKKADWHSVSRNIATEAIELLEYHKEDIDWDELSGNTNPRAIELLKANPENINWDIFSGNIANEAIAFMFEKYHNNINWSVFSGNTNTKAIIPIIFKRKKSELRWKTPRLTKHKIFL